MKALVLSLLLAAGAHAADRPNVIFLMADDLGYDDVGFNGNTLVKTPNLDGMARDGIRFSRFYSVGPHPELLDQLGSARLALHRPYQVPSS